MGIIRNGVWRCTNMNFYDNIKKAMDFRIKRKAFMMKKINWNILYGIAALLGAVIFVLIYGIHILNPFYTDWLISGGDLTQHYLGWEYYRRSDWFFPIGLTNQLAYPVKTSVIFTDSIPIFAVIFKIFTSGFEARFQYFGIWGLCCFMLQGYWAARILQRWLTDKWQVLLGSVFFVISPIVIFRMYYHTALAAHWLILISIYLCAVHKNNYKKLLKTSLQWGILGVLIGSIHLYFIPMCAMLLGGYVLYSFIEEKKIQVKYMIPGFSFLVGIFGTVWLLGGFSSGIDTGSSDSLGYYSFNLNGFVNPIGYSKIMKWLDVYKEGQYEGFAYLGLGIIILFISALIGFAIAWKKWFPIMKKKWLKVLIAVGIIFGLVLLAASPKVTFNSHLLFELPDIDMIMKYWSIFGSSGRIIWPVYYLIILFAIIETMKFLKQTGCNKVVAYVLLLICLGIQVYDISGKLQEKHMDYAELKDKSITLESNFWEMVDTTGYEHVLWVSHNMDKREILCFADWALEQGLTMSNYYFARAINMRPYVEEEMKALNEKTLYIFIPEDDTFEYEMYRNYEDILYLYEADGYMIGSVLPIETS